MPDREKVIQGLMHCGFTEERGCNGCPYDGERGQWGDAACTGSLTTDALELLKEQEAVKPIEEMLAGGAYSMHKCGACESWVRLADKYCEQRGRKAKWDD